MKGYFVLSRAIALLVVSTCVTSSLASKNSPVERPDPKTLVGANVEGHAYPDGWIGVENPFFDERYSLDGQIIRKQATHAFILRRILKERTDSSPRRTVIVDAVQLGINSPNASDVLTSQCKHPDIQLNPDQRIFAEVRFRRCERYSSRVRAAWLVDSPTQSIRPITPKGMRCVDTFFNNGPDGPTCPSVSTDWEMNDERS